MRYGSLIVLAILVGGCALFTPSRPIGAIAPAEPGSIEPDIRFVFESRDTSGEQEKISELIEKTRRGEIKSIAQGLTQTSREFYIQVYASASRKFAQKIRNELRKKVDYPIIIKDIPPLYRVRIGPFYRPEDAREALKKIKDMGYRDAFIVEEIALGK